jgi:hypothetical protein
MAGLANIIFSYSFQNNIVFNKLLQKTLKPDKMPEKAILPGFFNQMSNLKKTVRAATTTITALTSNHQLNTTLKYHHILKLIFTVYNK